MLETLDATAVRRWCAAGLAALRRHQAEIDRLNVFPVPDGDTGTNLVLTLTSAHEALHRPGGAPGSEPGAGPGGDPEPHAAEALRAMARGALFGARGNSGVILSQLLKGIADALAGEPAAGGRALAGALREAAVAAYAAVAEPVEGTVLSVARAAAEAAERAVGAGAEELCPVARAAAEGAATALARTPEQLPALARAGVVDAGGRGLVVLLDALVAVVAEEEQNEGERAEEERHASPSLHTFHADAGAGGFGYEVQYLLEADGPAVARLREVLAGLGDSLVVVGDGGDPPTWHVHVHVDDVGAAVEAGVAAGRPHHISVTRFADQIAGRERPERGAVVVAAGEGLAALFAEERAAVVGGNPSTAEILDAVRATGAAAVVVLPNDKDTRAVAAAAAREAQASGVRVSVVPTRSPVQALAALAVRDPGRPFEDDVIAMAEAAGACRYAEVTVAAREALTVAGRCRPGDVLGLVDGEVHLIGAELEPLCRDLLDRLLGGGGELVTLLTGAGAPDGLAESLAAHLAAHWPFVEVHHYDGGQPHYPLLVGVE